MLSGDYGHFYPNAKVQRRRAMLKGEDKELALSFPKRGRRERRGFTVDEDQRILQGFTIVCGGARVVDVLTRSTEVPGARYATMCTWAYRAVPAQTYATGEIARGSVSD